MLSKSIVGVLRGGPSSEYEISLKSGAVVLRNMPEKFSARDIFIDREGFWHLGGIRRTPREISRTVSVVFNALHGEFGEDGRVQEILESLGTPYTGSRNFASRLAMNKMLAKSFLAREGILMPKHALVEKDLWNRDTVERIFQTLVFPVIVKPLALGSSVGISIAKNFFDLEQAILRALSFSDQVMVEEYVSGREATGAVLENWQNRREYTLPIIEIVSLSENGFFDYDAKYNGQSEEICPGRFNEDESREIRRLSALIHKVLGMRHYSRSDFIVRSNGEVVFLETNTLPGLTEESLLPKALRAEGVSLPEFIAHVVGEAYAGR